MYNVYAQEETGKSHALSWEMALLKKNGSAYESIPFRQPLTMTRRDSYQLYLAFQGEGYCYVIQEDDEGKLPLVYRQSFMPGDRIILPEGAPPEKSGGDFRAGDLPGTSRLYVIVSAQPRQNMERLMDQYERESASTALERSLFSEVLAIRRNVAAPPDAPETSVPPAATDPAMKGELRLFEGRDAWVITITVRVR